MRQSAIQRLFPFVNITLLPLLTVIGLLTGFLSLDSYAAGERNTGLENSPIAEVTVNEEWDQHEPDHYEYYPDGTIKSYSYRDTAGLNYEGHYDPQGNLMDPSFTFYAGYVEGILIDPKAKPVREYDSNGCLTHFEALGLDFDGTAPYLIKADYEYEDNNRVSRVKREVEYLDEDIYSLLGDGTSTGSIFSYASDGSYTISSESHYGWLYVSRISYSYDAEHHLIRFDSSSETIQENGDRFAEYEIHVFCYEEDGQLSRQFYYRNLGWDKETPVEIMEYE